MNNGAFKKTSISISNLIECEKMLSFDRRNEIDCLEIL